MLRETIKKYIECNIEIFKTFYLWLKPTLPWYLQQIYKKCLIEPPYILIIYSK